MRTKNEKPNRQTKKRLIRFRKKNYNELGEIDEGKRRWGNREWAKKKQI